MGDGETRKGQNNAKDSEKAKSWGKSANGKADV